MERKGLSVDAVKAERPIEEFLFVLSKGASLTFGKLTERQGSYSDSDKSQNLDSKVLKHASNLAILALVEHDFDPCPAIAAADHARAFGPK